MSRVVIIDYGQGNANSIKVALASLGVESVYSRETRDIDAADYLILPGVGHYGAAMQSLGAGELRAALERAARERRVPTLGICLGMQLMTKWSDEGASNGLGWVDARTTRIKPVDTRVHKVPHVGWTLLDASPARLLESVQVAEEPFYFCHSYAIDAVADATVASFGFDRSYVGLFERENLFGVQFHPEKSQEAGLRLLSNFLRVRA